MRYEADSIKDTMLQYPEVLCQYNMGAHPINSLATAYTLQNIMPNEPELDSDFHDGINPPAMPEVEIELTSEHIPIPPKALLYSLPSIFITCAGPALLSSLQKNTNFCFDNTHTLLLPSDNACISHFTTKQINTTAKRLIWIFFETTNFNVHFKAKNCSIIE
eukprot:1310437-Ditylum_brightwellii.AAC.1